MSYVMYLYTNINTVLWVNIYVLLIKHYSKKSVKKLAI